MEVSRKTVTIWKMEGRIVMVGDRVDADASRERLSRTIRNVTHRVAAAHKKDRRGASRPLVTSASSADAALAPLPATALTASAAIEVGACDLARILIARGMGTDEVYAVAEEWTRRQREGWVGAPSGPVSVAEEERWPLPPGCSHWYEHSLFTGPAIEPFDWEEIAQEAVDAH